MTILAGIVFEEESGGTILRAMPLLLFVLCALAIAYRYYSAFLAAKVAVLDDARITPAHTFNDGQNYHPTSKWVLFGHHFAAISGAGPLIGPVLAIQYGYMPGLLWLVIGVCLAGAVQDMLVLAASVRRGGKSLAQIALTELGKPAAIIVSLAILFIVVIALAGLGFVVVKALGGEDVKLPKGMVIILTEGQGIEPTKEGLFETAGKRDGATILPCTYNVPRGANIGYQDGAPTSLRPEGFQIRHIFVKPPSMTLKAGVITPSDGKFVLDDGWTQVVPGSSWGTVTIACTIPISLFVGLWMYKIRKGRVVEASIIGGVVWLGTTVLGPLIPGAPL